MDSIERADARNVDRIARPNVCSNRTAGYCERSWWAEPAIMGGHNCQHPVSNDDWRGSLTRRRSGERLHPGDVCLTHPRYAIIIGKISGSSITSLFQLVGVFAVALLLRIPLGGVDIVRLLLLSPSMCGEDKKVSVQQPGSLLSRELS